jgi:hypothetical protein
MRYKLGIMARVISIFESFEFVASIMDFDYVTFAWTLWSFPCFTLVVNICALLSGSPLGIDVLLGGPLEESSCHSRTYMSLSTCHPLISLPFCIFECIDPRRNCPSFHGKKGLKAQRLVARKR